MERFGKIILGLGVFFAVLTIIASWFIFKDKQENDVDGLFSTLENSYNVFTYEQIKTLPTPVQRYFRYSLAENQPYIDSVRLKHGGLFRLKENWMPITGEEYFTTQNPGFVWYGNVRLFSAKDSYYEGKGNLKVKLLSLIKIVDVEGKEVDQGELLRWLGEAVWYPTVLLPSENLKWVPIDDNSAKAILTDRNISVEGIFYFNEKGQMIQFKTKRYMDKSLENWTGYYRDYKEVGGMNIPFEVEVVWNLGSGDFSYAKFNITKIEYNNPTKFE